MALNDHNIKYDTPLKSYTHVELHQRVLSGRQHRQRRQQRRQQQRRQQQQQHLQKSLHSHNSVNF